MRFSVAFQCFLIVAIGSALFASPFSAKPVSRNAQQEGEKQLLALHLSEKEAHFSHDAQWFTDHVAPEILDVRDGHVNRMSRADVKARFDTYFRTANFSKWNDVQPPIVRVSPDGQFGWMIVRVRIAYSGTDALGKDITSDSVLAWMAGYEKRSGKWIMTAVTTTSATPK